MIFERVCPTCQQVVCIMGAKNGAKTTGLRQAREVFQTSKHNSPQGKSCDGIGEMPDSIIVDAPRT